MHHSVQHRTWTVEMVAALNSYLRGKMYSALGDALVDAMVHDTIDELNYVIEGWWRQALFAAIGMDLGEDDPEDVDSADVLSFAEVHDLLLGE